MTTTKTTIDFDNPQEVSKYLDIYKNLLSEDLPDYILMTFVGVLYEARGRENLDNRRKSIDYLGFTGFGREELERIAKNSEEVRSLRKLANDWLRNREGKMMGYLCLSDQNNEFGRKNGVLQDHNVEGVVISFIGKGHLNEIKTVYLTKVQRLNLGYNVNEFRPRGYDERWSSLGEIYLTSRGTELRAECCKTDHLIDGFYGCGIVVSKSLAQELSLKVGSRVELSKKPWNERFYV
ncbi:hypothetical protein HYW75_03780 [Candidatus Pacearchaeota archaeon]|nr:hypothetical protein [Candidatus Pacearchaeota archaeon]